MKLLHNYLGLRKKDYVTNYREQLLVYRQI